MAAPFGGHPTLLDYLEWCADQGCTTRSMVQQGKGILLPRQYIEHGDRHVIISGIGLKERLTPTQVGYYDRRLGLLSPFAKIWDETVH